MSDWVRQSISFSKPADEWLKGEAEKLGISVSELVRRIVDEQRGGTLVKVVQMIFDEHHGRLATPPRSRKRSR